MAGHFNPTKIKNSRICPVVLLVLTKKEIYTKTGDEGLRGYLG
jgi:hypothetical protein